MEEETERNRVKDLKIALRDLGLEALKANVVPSELAELKMTIRRLEQELAETSKRADADSPQIAKEARRLNRQRSELYVKIGKVISVQRQIEDFPASIQSAILRHRSLQGRFASGDSSHTVASSTHPSLPEEEGWIEASSTHPSLPEEEGWIEVSSTQPSLPEEEDSDVAELTDEPWSFGSRWVLATCLLLAIASTLSIGWILLFSAPPKGESHQESTVAQASAASAQHRMAGNLASVPIQRPLGTIRQSSAAATQYKAPIQRSTSRQQLKRPAAGTSPKPKLDDSDSAKLVSSFKKKIQELRITNYQYYEFERVSFYLSSYYPRFVQYRNKRNEVLRAKEQMSGLMDWKTWLAQRKAREAATWRNSRSLRDFVRKIEGQKQQYIAAARFKEEIRKREINLWEDWGVRLVGDYWEDYFSITKYKEYLPLSTDIVRDLTIIDRAQQRIYTKLDELEYEAVLIRQELDEALQTVFDSLGEEEAYKLYEWGETELYRPR